MERHTLLSSKRTETGEFTTKEVSRDRVDRSLTRRCPGTTTAVAVDGLPGAGTDENKETDRRKEVENLHPDSRGGSGHRTSKGMNRRSTR